MWIAEHTLCWREEDISMRSGHPSAPGYRGLRNWLRRVAAIVLVPLVLVVVASPAQAHPNVVATFPDAGFNSADSPKRIGLAFDEPVSVQHLSLHRNGGETVSTTKPRLTQRGNTIYVKPTTSLPQGVYTARWQITAEDGDIVSGSFEFSVGVPGSSLPSGLVDSSTVDPVVVGILRWLVFVGLSLGLGGVLGDYFVRDRVRRAQSGEPVELYAPRPWTGVGATVGVVAVAGLVGHQIGGGDLAGSGRSFTVDAFASSQVGPLLVAELAGFAMALFASAAGARRVTAIGLLLVVVAEGWRSHVHAQSAWFGSVTIGVHVAVAAIWVGTLIHIVRTAIIWREQRRQIVALFRRYIRFALYGYLIVVTTGTMAAILVLPSWGSLTENLYGRILLAKIGAVLLVSALALGARRGLGRPISTFQWRGLKLAKAERVALIGVVAFSALLTTVAPPRPERSGLVAFPAPITRPAVYVGTLAGQVSTALIASDSRVLIRLDVPDSSSAPRHRVEATTRFGNDGPTRLRLRPCGTGCFTAPVAWHLGRNVVDLNIRSQGWQGGGVRFVVPWPPQDGQRAFDRMRKAMSHRSRLVLTEHVTSNTQSSQSMSSTLSLSE
ncbi:MAG: copper resistance protein CopC, partial [Aeromicrobium sp.]